jgi:DNA-directed RNA polymerase specialized sigma24 family protein
VDKTLDSRLEQARAGSSAAWRALVGEHLGAVYAICRAFGLDGSAAGEVNQAVWLRLAEHLPRIRTPAALGGWIAATTRRECLDHSRDAGRSGWIVGGLSVRLDDGAEATDVADCVTLGRAFARIGAGAQRLLRLSAVRPRLSDEVVAAALDVAAPRVPIVRSSSLERLGRLASLDARADPTPGPAPRPADVERALVGVIAIGDPVPLSWWTAADAAFGWLCIDAELANIVYDSVGTSKRLARRSLRFSTGPRNVDVIIDIANGTSGGAHMSLSGRVDVDAATLADLRTGEREVTARWPGGAVLASIGPDGGFELHDLPLAPLSVEVDGNGGDHVTTTGFKTGWIFP